MPALNTDNLQKVGLSTATTLSAPGYTAGNTSITVGSTTNWPTDTGVTFAIDTVTIVNGEEVQDAGSYNEFVGTVATGTTITNVDWVDGAGDTDYSAGSTTRVYIPVSKTRENRIVTWGLTEHDQDGTHAAITGTSAVFTGDVTAANFVQTGGSGADGWTVGLATPNTVTANGNRSYSCVFNATDLTSTLSPGMRLRTTRTVSAPTQCTSLNGTTQYYSKSSPSAMTFTDDFVVSAWVKPTSYAQGVIASRYNGTSGWVLRMEATGQLSLLGYNAGAGNASYVQTYQSLPLNKWSHIAMQLDMSTFTATTTTSYVMIDGVDVPATVARGGTNPTALVQPVADLQIGAANSTLFFPGKIAQVAIYNAKVTQATILASINQGLSGSETSLISAYSFNNTINDLSANANNLTANGAAVATNADSPFGGQASGLISATLDYGIIQSVTFSTNTTVVVQVPEGCTIPTSGGVSAVSYSTQKAPYGFPAEQPKWVIEMQLGGAGTGLSVGGTTNGTWYNAPGGKLVFPAGKWKASTATSVQVVSGSTAVDSYSVLSTTAAADGVVESRAGVFSGGSTSNAVFAYRAENIPISVATATPYYFNFKTTNSSISSHNLRSDYVMPRIAAENAYL